MTITNIKNLTKKVDQIKHKDRKCSYSRCTNPSINSHTLSKSMLYKLNADLTKIRTFETKLTPFISNPNHKHMKPISLDKFSTFIGFCPEHDDQLFKPIDQFDGIITKEKACLIHYRNICYGINHIKTQQKKFDHISSQNYIEDESTSAEGRMIFNQMKKNRITTRLKYCLQQHNLRKYQLEEIIKSNNFDQMDFLYLIGDTSNPVFCGRSSIALHPKHNLFGTNGYGCMPWITYMTLLTNHKNYLVFCWLKRDKKLVSHLKYLCKTKAPKKIIEVLAYGYSDSLAVDEELYERHSEKIENIRKHLGAF